MADVVFSLPPWQAVLLCLLFAVIYVGSLYVWNGSVKDKNSLYYTPFMSEVIWDHPEVIQKRFISVSCVCVIVPIMLWMVSTNSTKVQARGILEWLGIRFWGVIPAFIVPLFLTMVLFLGPLSLHYLDGVFRLYLEAKYWTTSVKNYVWLRNHVVAPLSEELIFRACMLPLLVPALGSNWAIFVCPLFFGVAHFHHMIEKVVQGHADVSDALKQSFIQLGYTTVFGAYSAYLFLRTGHLMAPVIAHAFCNHMGFPDINEVFGYPPSIKNKLIILFALGLICWLGLLRPLTTPLLYSNDVYQM